MTERASQFPDHAKSAEFDAITVGTGPAGLLAACLLGRAGVHVAAVGPLHANSGDTRTTALMSNTIRLLDRIGLWPELEKTSQPLRTMRIVDRLGRGDHPSVMLFEAQEIGEDSFASNVVNTELVSALEAFAARQPAVTRIAAMVKRVSHSPGRVEVETECGSTLAAPVAIAADGRHSMLRDAAGIPVTPIDYNQSALTATIAHSDPHNDISTEIHRSGGPLTTVPLPGRRSAIVWLEKKKDADEIGDLPDDRFTARLDRELGGLLGDISLDGPRGRYPIIGLAVGALARKRTALIGEAAHVVPPIGAQGLNLGFRDAAEVADRIASAVGNGLDPGSANVLDAYARARRRDVLTRRAATDLLNRSLLFDFPPLVAARGLGMALVSGLGPLRRAIMREGFGRNRDLPRLMRDDTPAQI